MGSLLIIGIILLIIIFRKLIFGYCYGCGKWFKYPKKRRRNTAYVDDKKNYVTLCIDCYQEQEIYWQERWDEYNAGRY